MCVPQRVQAVADDQRRHTPPIIREHIGLSGDFPWDRAAAAATGRRPLYLGRRRQAA